MCRLFGLLGGPTGPAAPWLVESDRSLLAQAHASEATAQKDGWGIGWYEGTRVPRVEKGPRGAYEPGERERFEQIARRAHGPVVVGHLRHASNPMRLPRARLIGLENCQPFTYEGYLFAHNGEIPLPRETRPRLGKFEAQLRGVNDSEVLFWLFVRNLEARGDPVTAFQRTREELEEVWNEHARRTPEPYTGLNVLFSRGPKELWAFCLWRGEHGPGLLNPHQPYYRMGYQTDTKMLLVGSEPFDARAKGWRPLENGEYLVGQVDHGLVGVRTGGLG
jgi:predicted glutamine amidotransferase